MSLVDNPTALCWIDGLLAPAAERESVGPLLVADSWLVVDGATRAQDAHWARFGDSCRELGVETAAFRRAVTGAVPEVGRWWPRVELTAGGALCLRVRPAPAPAATGGALRVVVAPPGDPRSHPRRKGPDLDMLIGLRSRSGADELLLCDADGRLREGTSSSLLWWEDGVLWTTPAEHTLPGVTRALVVGIARGRGVDVRVRAPLPAQLAGREVWLTSALHGIRAVGEWVSPQQPAGPAEQAPAWQAALEAMR
jgi:branched-subunit amino acid aminotransferase/4-amino-4-deoxychorismate lyase